MEIQQKLRHTMTPSIAFNPNGLSGIGYAYLSNKSKSAYYRVGMLYATGSIKIEKWDGAQWK